MFRYVFDFVGVWEGLTSLKMPFRGVAPYSQSFSSVALMATCFVPEFMSILCIWFRTLKKIYILFKPRKLSLAWHWQILWYN